MTTGEIRATEAVLEKLQVQLSTARLAKDEAGINQ